MDQQKQEQLIQKIVENEIKKVKQETQQLLEAIQVESEERLREKLSIFQKKELAMQDAFNKAISRAEAYGKRKAMEALKGEMEALVERVRVAEEEVWKERQLVKEKEKDWAKERFEWQVSVERALLSERGYKRNFKKILRKIKLEFRYSLNEAKSDLMDKAKSIATKHLEKKLYADVRKEIIKSQLKHGQQTLVKVHDGTIWAPLQQQMFLKTRLLNELFNTTNADYDSGEKLSIINDNIRSRNFDNEDDTSNYFIKSRKLHLKHVENIVELKNSLPPWVINHHNNNNKSHRSSSSNISPVNCQSNDSLISNVTPPLSPMSPHLVNDNSIQDISFNNNNNLTEANNSTDRHPDSIGKNVNNDNSAYHDDNVSLMWPSNATQIYETKKSNVNFPHFQKKSIGGNVVKKNALFDRTNLNVYDSQQQQNIGNKSILEPMEPIDFPQNPFTIVATTTNRSGDFDLLPHRDSSFKIKEDSENEGINEDDKEDNFYQQEQEQQEQQQDVSDTTSNYSNNEIVMNNDGEVSVSSDGFLRSDSIVFLWRKELEQEIQFKQMLPHFVERIQIRNIPIKLFKKLIQFWDLAGLPYFARIKTSQRLINSDVSSEQSKNIMKTMCKKLMKFVEERKRELLAIRKREEMKNKIELHEDDEIDRNLVEKYNKLNVVLERVILRWEETNNQQFLFRGLPYIKILKID